MSEPITEIVVFRSKPGQAARVRELAHHAVDEARKHGGLVEFMELTAEQILVSHFHPATP